MIVSIHDVMPQTLGEVKEILQVLESLNIRPVTLLVVPDSGWSEREVSVLHDFQDIGYELAGHGGRHQCAGPKTFGHTLHSMFFSRNVAEHLSRSSQQIADLIERCFQWFPDVGLHPPALYVPPAWAMGHIAKNLLADLPFRMYEYLTGVYDSDTRIFFRLPLIGYEADTWGRVWSLRLLNFINHGVSVFSGRPLRIAIHPYDLTLGLASDLRAFLTRDNRCIRYQDLL